MRVCHDVPAVFDDPNLVSCAGLAPVLQRAERAGLQRLVGQHLHLDKPGGVNAHLKIPTLVAGMVAGADLIEDMALLRHGAMGRLFTGVRARQAGAETQDDAEYAPVEPVLMRSVEPHAAPTSVGPSSAARRREAVDMAVSGRRPSAPGVGVAPSRRDPVPASGARFG